MIQITSITQNANRSWTFAWTDTGVGPYRVVLWGLLLGTVTTPTFTYGNPEYRDSPPPLEITPANGIALSEQFPPFVVFQWYGENCREYQVQQGGLTVKTLQETGQWVYTYKTTVMQDETTYQFQVVPEDNVGNLGVPRIYKKYLVTPPQPPLPENMVVYNIMAPPIPPVQPPPTRNVDQQLYWNHWIDYYPLFDR